MCLLESDSLKQLDKGSYPRRTCTYRIDFEIPWFTRNTQVNSDFLVLEAKFFEYDMGTMRPGTVAVGIENDLG